MTWCGPWSSTSCSADAIPWDTFTDPTTTFTADGQWTNCSDTSQPGIAPIVSYLATLPWHPASNCASGRYNMINNLSPGILPNAAHR